MEPFGNQPCFKFVERAIWVLFYPKDPFAANWLPPWGKSNCVCGDGNGVGVGKRGEAEGGEGNWLGEVCEETEVEGDTFIGCVAGGGIGFNIVSG